MSDENKTIHFGNLYEQVEDAVINIVEYAAQEAGRVITIEEEQELEQLEKQMWQWICKINGHDIEPDQCGIPAHDYCCICMTRVGDLVRTPLDKYWREDRENA